MAPCDVRFRHAGILLVRRRPHGLPCGPVLRQRRGGIRFSERWMGRGRGRSRGTYLRVSSNGIQPEWERARPSRGKRGVWPAAKRCALPAEGEWEPRRGRPCIRSRPFPACGRGHGSRRRQDPGRRTSLRPAHGSNRRPGPRPRNARSPPGTTRDRVAGLAPGRCRRPRSNERRPPEGPGLCDAPQSPSRSLDD